MSLPATNLAKNDCQQTSAAPVAKNGQDGKGREAPGAMRASHILVKNKNSRRAASWRDPDGKVIRNREEDEVRTTTTTTA